MANDVMVSSYLHVFMSFMPHLHMSSAGEILEWTGAAIASTSPCYIAFAIFTCLVLASRAYHSHNWYRATFPTTYPKQRKAVIPFVY